MIDAYQDKRIRLVPLIATLASIEKPLLALGQVYDLAMKGEVHLYVQIPTDKIAYVDSSQPIVIHPRSRMFTSDTGFSGFLAHSPFSYKSHPEVTHLTLDPVQAEELKTRRITGHNAFASGLSLHPDSLLAQAGWSVPCQFGALLVIGPAPPELEAENKITYVSVLWLQVTPEDVYVDARIVALLTEPQAPDLDDLFQYRDRAPGVYTLYCAARDYHAALKEKRISFKVIQTRITKKLPMLNEDDAASLIKFIRPRYRRNSGIPPGKQRQLDKDIVDSPGFIARYRQQTFINDALGLVFYVTDRWLDSITRVKEGRADQSWGRWDVRNECRKLGFYEHELEALIRLLFEHKPTSRS